MDIKEIISDIKERLTSPLFGSFVVSWLFINYKIPVALLFYKVEDLERDGYKSYLDVIHKDYSFLYMYVVPAAIAVAYIVIYPFIRRKISVYHAGQILRTDNEIDENAKDATINMEKFLSTQAKYKDQKSVLAELINTEGVIAEENRKLQREINAMKTSHRSAINELKISQNSEITKIQNDEQERTLKLQNDHMAAIKLLTDQLNDTHEDQVKAMSDHQKEVDKLKDEARNFLYTIGNEKKQFEEVLLTLNNKMNHLQENSDRYRALLHEVTRAQLGLHQVIKVVEEFPIHHDLSSGQLVEELAPHMDALRKIKATMETYPGD